MAHFVVFVAQQILISTVTQSPQKDTSGPSLNILIKLMSVISLTMAPLMAGNDDWPSNWYIGLVCIILLIVGTYLVYYFFWKDVDTMTFNDRLTPTTAKSSTLSFSCYTGKPISDHEVPPIDEEAPAPAEQALSASSGTPPIDEEPPTMDAT